MRIYKNLVKTNFFSNIDLHFVRFLKEYKLITDIDVPRGNQNLRSIVQLTKNYRFPDESIVGKVSKCIN